MIKRKDILVIAIVLAVAAMLYAGMRIWRADKELSGVVEVRAGSELFASARLDTPREIVVEQPGGEVNVIVIDETGVRMTHSSCKNQLCVQQGTVSVDNWTRRSMGRSIVCLPNQVLVELLLDEGHTSLDEADIPDI